ncbi:hypothetical protein Misp02_63160 [Microtetraspora sp. NBRC 16547]|nr:hypothetical protein Misp02_63160 [Microtetraspora sp. NBRC 16547]
MVVRRATWASVVAAALAGVGDTRKVAIRQVAATRILRMIALSWGKVVSLVRFHDHKSACPEQALFGCSF